MQTVQIDIADDKLDTFLTIVENLQKDIVKGITLKDTKQNDLSGFEDEVKKGLESTLSDKSHKEIFKDLKSKYA